MGSAAQIRLMDALRPCLRLLVRLMLRSGVGYKQFSELAKEAFVLEALNERDGRGRRINLSRVSVRTGISRKEVARLRRHIGAQENAAVKDVIGEHLSGHAARVLQLWHADSRFVDSHGGPRPLPPMGKGVTFAFLVKAAGGDVPPGAVRAELADAGALAETENGLLVATKRHFIPSDVGEELQIGLTHFVMPVLSGLARNTDKNCGEPFIQRLAYSDRLGPAAVPQFRDIVKKRATEFLQSADDWLSANETSVKPFSKESLRVGIGVFYYEGKAPEEEPDQGT